MLAALIITIAAIRVKRADLAGNPHPAGQPSRGPGERRDAQGRVTAERRPGRADSPRAHRRADGQNRPGPAPDDLRSNGRVLIA
jgi:hypothetical protein